MTLLHLGRRHVRDRCTAEDHRGAPSLRPIIVKMPKHDAATAKSWMLQQPMVVARVGGVAGV